MRRHDRGSPGCKALAALAVALAVAPSAASQPPPPTESPPQTAAANGPCPATDAAALERQLGELADKVEPGEGFWLVSYRGVGLLVFAHEELDRMRIATPVAPSTGLDVAQLRLLLEANYDRALDAKYSLFKGRVWSGFAHPLSSLTRRELESALDQVVTLRANYGSTYASTSMRFGRSGH